MTLLHPKYTNFVEHAKPTENRSEKRFSVFGLAILPLAWEQRKGESEREKRRSFIVAFRDFFGRISSYIIGVTTVDSLDNLRFCLCCV